MSGPRIQITNPKLLTEEDFASLRGTSLYEQLFRNRCSLSILNRSSSAQKVAENEVVEWLKDNCHTFYYFDSETGYVFIEGDADVLNFKMKFDDHDVVYLILRSSQLTNPMVTKLIIMILMILKKIIMKSWITVAA